MPTVQNTSIIPFLRTIWSNSQQKRSYYTISINILLNANNGNTNQSTCIDIWSWQALCTRWSLSYQLLNAKTRPERLVQILLIDLAAYSSMQVVICLRTTQKLPNLLMLQVIQYQ
uniref:Uncharacterized protein n=1 Tax=Arundo donax TaxID=35708 RepID=A0A0A9FYP4_ARUDO